MKAKIEKWVFHSKENNQQRRQPTQEKIFANHSSDKELISIIYKEFLKLSNRRTSNPIKWIQEEIRMCNKSRKTYSISLAIGEMQIKTTRRYHLTSVKIIVTNNK
jgi:ribonucleotide reductase beta subunit family protein with ferritin-like domain